MIPKVDLLDHGFVRRIDFMGSDLNVVRAARVSYDAAWRAGEDDEGDRKLLRRLWSGGKKVLGDLPKHSTPFEAVTVTFEIMAPIFVFRQWHRHRTQSYNELSARYRELPETFYIPDPARVGVQSTNNKQGRTLIDDPIILAMRLGECELLRTHCEGAYRLYKILLQRGWPKELARTALPVNWYSHMFATANLLNWLKFLSLRADEHAQYEVRVYADAIADLLTPLVPHTMNLWKEAMSCQ